MTHASRHSGFTLFELVLVMFIMTIMVAIVAPNLRGFRDARVREHAATQLVSVMRWARTEAISTATTHRVEFDQAGNYSVSARQGGQFTPLASKLARDYSIPPGYRLEVLIDAEAGRNFIDFFPSGRSQPATLRLTDPDGIRLEVASASPAEPFRLRNAEVSR